MLLPIVLFFITIVQNASFTLVSRARNSGSYIYNGIASVFSNGIYLLVLWQVATKPNDTATAVAYISGAVIGSVLMQWVAIRFLEKKKVPVVQKPSIGRIVNYHGRNEDHAAIVVGVWDSDRNIVDLRVFDPALSIETGVVQGKGIGYWDWPKIVK